MPQLEVTQEYRQGFIRAEQTFVHQLVYDPIGRKLIPLNPYPDGADPAAFSFAGSYLNEDVAFQLALGNLDVDTLAKLDDFHPEKSGIGFSKRTTIWSGDYVPTKAQPAVRESPEETARPVMTKTVRTNVEFRLPPAIISDQDLTGQYALPSSDSPPDSPTCTSPILSSRKRKRTDENSPAESSPLSSRSPFSNPFAKTRVTSPTSNDCSITSPTGIRLLRTSQLKVTEADGREVVVSSYFASSSGNLHFSSADLH